jgi:hypothetical protein
MKVDGFEVGTKIRRGMDTRMGSFRAGFIATTRDSHYFYI